MRVIEKTSAEYALEADPPPCPSVKVDDRWIARNDVVTHEALSAAILAGGARGGVA